MLHADAPWANHLQAVERHLGVRWGGRRFVAAELTAAITENTRRIALRLYLQGLWQGQLQQRRSRCQQFLDSSRQQFPVLLRDTEMSTEIQQRPLLDSGTDPLALA